MIKAEFNDNIQELEALLQKMASDVASDTIYEKLSPQELLSKTEPYIASLRVLIEKSEEFMLILKPERALTIKSMCKRLTQTLANFKEILLQNTADPLANSRLAFEQLRKAVADSSDILFIMREVRDNPSPLIDSILSFKKASENKASVVSIQAREDVEPLVKYVLSRIDDFRALLIILEKKVDEMKQIMRELQEESIKILSKETSTKSESKENRTENGQLSLANFNQTKYEEQR
ncbi:MAG: hypothetical protein ACP5IM_03285 [Candidatus Bathyarchaeia archaeon]|nr:MAG: hypothetical protein C0195_03090 [Candidatus Bathyarchaeota archaeon]